MADLKRYSTKTTQTIAGAAVEREARRTSRALWIEQGLSAFWPAWSVVLLFAGLVMLGVPAMLPPLAHYALLGVFALSAVALTIRGAARLRRPTRDEALARLDAGAPGRPARTYAEALAAGSGDKGTETLWAAHQRALAERAAALKAQAADLRLSSRDPYALRHGAALIFAIGLIAWQGADPARLADQLRPGAVAAGPASPTPTLEAWASPPVYTGARAVYLTQIGSDHGPVDLPVGTEISLRVFDTETPPELSEDVGPRVPGAAPEGGETGEGVAETVGARFEDKGAGVYDAVFTVERSGEVSVVIDGAADATWTFTALPDAPPTVAFDGEPTSGERGALTLPYVAGDDYGVRLVEGLIELDDEAPSPVRGLDLATSAASIYEPIPLDLPMPLTGDGREIAETLIEDLTEHPWAGLPVRITLTAMDAADQTGAAVATTILPARRFYHPMAKALVEQRRWLALSPDAAPRVLDVLEALMVYPEEMFDDTAAFLAARMAVRRMGYALEEDRLEEELSGVVDLLWKAAIRLEDGDLSNAAERLARAQERLRDAIENGATEDEISRLMEELRQAMQEYMAEMMREALRDQANGQQQQQQQGQQGEQQTITQQDIEDMLQQLEEAMRNGQQELARQMLQALQEMMNNMQMAQPGQGQPGQGEQMMNQMGDMIGEQQGLADRSFNQMQQGQEGARPGENPQGGGEGQGQEGDPNGMQGSDPGDSAGDIARDQEQLRQLLDQLRGQMPGAAGEEARRALEEAERAMGDAVESLEQGDTRQAVDDQVRALDNLRDGRRALGQDLAEAQGQGQGDQAGREGPGGDAEREDPLGRPQASDGPIDGEGVRVPGATLGKRARELQDEIRRRSGERERPAEELDYLERLLDRF